MENNELIWHCAVIMSSARKLGFGLRYAGAEGTHAYEWFDPMAKVSFAGQSMAEKPDALKSACDVLVDYLQVKQPNDPKQHDYAF